MKFVLIAVAGILLLAVVVMLLRIRSAGPVAGGVSEGRLAPCPDRPNCVSSQAADSGHSVAPLSLTATAPLQRIKAMLAERPRNRLIEERPNYLHYVFSTPLWGFEDDVEFFHQPDEGIVHIRSASRLGYSDLGANRRRVEELRSQIAARDP